MGFENEFASYEPLRRILDSPKVRLLQDRLRVRKRGEQENGQEEFEGSIINKSDMMSDFIPDYVIAIDGSYQPSKVENGFPGAELGYITTSAVLIIEKSVREFAKQEFIDPKKFRETEKASSIETIIPGCNVIIKGEKSAKASMRKLLFEELQNTRVFEEGETLLETYEHLFRIKLEKDRELGKPRSPIDGVDQEMTYDFGQYTCPHSGETLYSTDAMRLHELMKPSGTNGEMYGQIMQMFEKLWLIHILRAFEKKDWLPLLDRVAFVLDGPLACFSTWSWINKSIITELARINKLQKKQTEKELLIFGIEKSGTFYNHFEEVDTKADGTSDRFSNQSAFLLSDGYIKRNIIFSESDKPYGQDTYFGRKLFYKTKTGYRIVPVLAFFNDHQQNLETARTDQYPRLADLMNVLDELVSSRYPNSVSPLVSAHAEAAIPLNLGKRIFDDIAREIRNKSLHP
ncbi:MAG: DNA double-strand break repair nuclease NurA [Euryarchaeota archaeon]|nr:DNA double-strand break repair nuclease NurA [Euryarchaeota archaeon]MBU4339794.1 DNA double-strand break repair nuclease NurA [Euryarchaeota archaeon]MCG2737027.1 DNA double-strand break repair nuclease NurA [Candidatus Methanoperedenaceae archaeon]